MVVKKVTASSSVITSQQFEVFSFSDINTAQELCDKSQCDKMEKGAEVGY